MKKNNTISILSACLAGACFISNQATAAQLLGTIHEIPQSSPEYTATNDLTLEGTTDWIMWLESFEQHTNLWAYKTNGPAAFSDTSIVGTDTPGSGRIRRQIFSFTDGANGGDLTVADLAPFAAGDTSTFANRGAGNGLQFTVAADATTKYIKVWFAGRDGGQIITASLPSVGTISFTNDNHGNYTVSRYAEIQFAANSSELLTVTTTVYTNGTVIGANTSAGFGAAIMKIPPPNVQILKQPASQTNFLPYATQFSVDAAGGLPITYQWYQQVNGIYVALTDNARISGSTTPNLTITNQVGTDATNYQVVVTSPYGGSVTSSVANLTVKTQISTVTGSREVAVPKLDLTLGGNLDWAHWGFVDITSFDQKAGGGNAIGTFSSIGSRPPERDDGAHQFASWSNGTPTAGASDSETGIYVERVNNGFQIPVAASTTPQVLTVWLWVRSTKIHFEAVLSDDSAAYIDEYEVKAQTGGLIAYTLTVAASSTGKTLNIRAYSLLDNDDAAGHGNIGLYSATLQDPVLKITLQPVSRTNFVNDTVSFVASAGGVLPLTNQWYGQSGGVFAPLTNSSKFSGVTTPTLTISTVQLVNGTNYYLVARSASGSVTSSVANLKVVTGTGVLQGGFQSITDSGTVVNLTAEGTLDWANWGHEAGGDFNHKEVGGLAVDQISNWTAFNIGSAFLEWDGFQGLLFGYSWTNGTPLASVSTTGFSPEANWINFNGSLGSGFQFTVPADTTRRVLRVYAGSHNCTVRIRGTLSDGSAADLVNESLDDAVSGDDEYGYVTMYYAAGAANQTLTVTVNNPVGAPGHASLSSATLATPTPVQLTATPSGSNLQLTWPYGTLLEATSVTGPYTPVIGSPVSSYTVAPSAPQMFYRVQLE